MLQQNGKNAKGFFLQAGDVAIGTQFSGAEIELKVGEADGRLGVDAQSGSPHPETQGAAHSNTVE